MATPLTFAERRVLGVLIEKSFATPEQYPLTLNALVNGANQKSCRDPVSDLSEEEVLDALDVLREKSLVTLVRTMGGRTDRYKHRVGDTLGLEGKEAAVLAELLLRGPQTDGELRQHAGRMRPFADLADLTESVRSLAAYEPALVRRLSPEGRKRGVKYAHTLYPPGEEPGEETDGAEASDSTGETQSSSDAGAARAAARLAGDDAGTKDVPAELEELRTRVAKLERDVAQLRAIAGARAD